ncbi:MAG: hypothetical protein IAG10_24630 [Planctomycetaceae bacterium]|nr:hypothetical protein [Planctomycetaceae bacterium]
MRNLVWTLASLVLVVCVTTAAWSSEADELRAKAKAVQKEADQASKEGRGEEAEKLFRHAKELLQAAQQHESKSAKAPNREDELQQQLKALAEKEEHAEKTKNKEALAELQKYRAVAEHELAQLREHGGKKIAPKHTGKHPPEAVEETGLRIKHIRVAVENLNAAGLHDIAEELAHKADAMEREHHQAHEKFAKEPSTSQKQKQPEKGSKYAEFEGKHPEPKGKHAPDAAAGDDLRHEVQRLRAELNELREGLKKRQ